MGKGLFKLDAVKNKASHRTYPIPDFLIERLEIIKKEQERHKSIQLNDYKDEGYIFAEYDGSVITPCKVYKSFLKILKKNGLQKMRFHDLRHPYVKHTLKNNCKHFLNDHLGATALVVVS